MLLTHPPTFCLFISQVCSNEVKCICDSDYTGKDCSVFDPIVIPTPDGSEIVKGDSTELFVFVSSFQQTEQLVIPHSNKLL